MRMQPVDGWAALLYATLEDLRERGTTPEALDLEQALEQCDAVILNAGSSAGREDLIGYGKHCLVRPERPQKPAQQAAATRKKGAKPPQKPSAKTKKPAPRRGGKGG